jgi:hypothetical protein
MLLFDQQSREQARGGQSLIIVIIVAVMQMSWTRKKILGKLKHQRTP